MSRLAYIKNADIYNITSSCSVNRIQIYSRKKSIFSDKLAYVSSNLVDQSSAHEKYQAGRQEGWSHFLTPSKVQPWQSCSLLQAGLPTSFTCGEQPKLYQKGIAGNASQDIKAGCVASMLDCTLSHSSLLKHRSKVICLPDLFRKYCAD